MIKKLQVIVREVYESEETHEVISNIKTGKEISNYDYEQLTKEDQEGFVASQKPTGKSKIEESEGDPIYGQIFDTRDLDITDLILHLNRTR
jgi:hypothetical protein